jgi:hypothetical protein
MNTITYAVKRDLETDRLAVDRPRGKLRAGLYGYQWTVTDETGKKHTLSGITERISARLSAYIRQMNRPITDESSKLHRLVREPKSTLVVKIIGPYDENSDPKEVESELIESVSEEENLNKTKGGNGGGSWSQYGDREPSVSSFTRDTPIKYYPFKVKNGRIVAELTPSIKRQRKGVYVIKHKETGDRYVGHSTNAVSRFRVHASRATHHPETSKVTQAIAQSPASLVFGLLPSTIHLSPLSERAAEIFHVADKRPEYNGDRGGGGPAPMKKRKLLPETNKSPAVRKLMMI